MIYAFLAFAAFALIVPSFDRRDFELDLSGEQPAWL